MFKRRSNLPFIAITGATALVVVSGLVALLSSLQIERLFQSAVTESLPAVHAAEELEILPNSRRETISTTFSFPTGRWEWLSVT